MERLLLFTKGRCIVAAATLAWSMSLFAIPVGAQENWCVNSATVGDDTEAKKHWIACNKELVKGQVRYGRPDWVNPGMEWRKVSAHKVKEGGGSWSVCGEVSEKDGVGRFGAFQRFISRGNKDPVIVENLYAEQDNHAWWRKMPFDRLWAKYCQ